MAHERDSSFEDFVIVACGTVRFELNHMRKSGFLNCRRVLYTKPGRHEVPRELGSQLVSRIAYARNYSDKIIVIYGGKFCYINANNPSRTIEQIIREQGPDVSKIEATHCVDMPASAVERRFFGSLPDGSSTGIMYSKTGIEGKPMKTSLNTGEGLFFWML